MSVACDYTLIDDGLEFRQALEVFSVETWYRLSSAAAEFRGSAWLAEQVRLYENGERNTAKPSKIKQSDTGKLSDALMFGSAELRPLLPESVVLYYADLWYNLPSTGRVYSQKWHRDPEGKTVYKAFLYMTDIGEECGPFEYVRGSHAGKYLEQVPWCSYPKADDACDFGDDAIRCTGRTGTLVIANTAGIHRGNRDCTGTRLIATWGWLPA